MLEPGLDKHLRESWWQQFDDDVQTSSGEALPELGGLIGQMLDARGQDGGNRRKIGAVMCAFHR